MANIGHPCQPSTALVAPNSFAKLVSLACHDLRTPLATASGFARTLERLDEIGQPAGRYVEMIGAATDQLAELLDFLSAAARIEDGRYEPQLRPTGTRELADAAAARIHDGRASVEGTGAEVRADPESAGSALSALAEAVRRHGGLERVTISVDGPRMTIGPLVDDAGAIALGENLRDFAAAVGARVLHTAGARIELDGERLSVTFPG
jgi:signal transduction histidine kinase